MTSEISRTIPRPDGVAKAGGGAAYIADIPYETALTARFYRSTFSRGRLTAVHIPNLPDGYFVVDHTDVPANNHVALIKTDWPAFASDEIRYKGQIILIVAGPDPREVDRILGEITVDYEPIPPAVTLDEGLACVGGAMHGTDNLYADITVVKGDPDRAFTEADRVIEGTYETGFQEQLYMEPQGLVVWPEADGHKVVIHGSLQCPYYVKHAVEETIGPGYAVQVIEATTGGAFGGKEDYPEIMAAPWRLRRSKSASRCA